MFTELKRRIYFSSTAIAACAWLARLHFIALCFNHVLFVCVETTRCLIKGRIFCLRLLYSDVAAESCLHLSLFYALKDLLTYLYSHAFLTRCYASQLNLVAGDALHSS